jgi:uncharacterized membrane protein
MNRSGTTQETLDRHEVIVGPSNRSFGITWTLVFTIAGLISLWRGGPMRTFALPIAAMFCVLALVWPNVLAPLNRVWLHISLGMHRVVNPVVMAVLFYGVVTPFGLVTRLCGKAVMRRSLRDPSATSYWISRAGQPVSRMDRQF